MNDPRAIEPWLPDLCRLPRLGATPGMAELAAAGGRLRIVIGNPSLPSPQPGAEHGGVRAGIQGAGHAQRSIAHRLGHAFGPRARMASAWREGYYRCEIDLPLP